MIKALDRWLKTERDAMFGDAPLEAGYSARWAFYRAFDAHQAELVRKDLRSAQP